MFHRGFNKGFYVLHYLTNTKKNLLFVLCLVYLNIIFNVYDSKNTQTRKHVLKIIFKNYNKRFLFIISQELCPNNHFVYLS